MSSKFQVNYLGQNLPNNKVILSGTGFGHIGHQPICFEVKVVSFDMPLRILFDVKVDKSKPELSFEKGEIQENQLSLIFYNPSEEGSSGLSAPLGLLVLGNDLLGFMFHIDRLPNSYCYRISYEFYHGTLEASVSGEKL
jgi:hypothetical protein